MKKKVMPACPALLSAALLLCALQASQAAPTTATPAATPKPAGNAAIDTKKFPIAARVEGEDIPTADLNRLVDGVVQDLPVLTDSTPDARKALAQIRNQLLENMISQRVIYREAKKDPTLLPTSQQIDTAVWNVQRRFANADDFNKWMADEGKTMEQLRDMLARRFVTEAWKNKVIATVKPSDVDYRNYYNANIDTFKIPDTVWARHIQFSFPKDAEGKMTAMTPQDKKKLQQKAQDILNKAKSSTADFPALAKENSDDLLSKARGGILDIPEVNDRAEIVSFRQITRDDNALVDPALFDVLLNTGVVGKVHPQLVETQFGFHIVKIEDRKAGRTLPYTDVADEIKPLALQELAKKAVDNRVKALMANAKIESILKFEV